MTTHDDAERSMTRRAVDASTMVLGIETSCDETAAAVVLGGTDVLSSVVASQLDQHARFGGVVPEIASRAHVEALPHVTARALEQARVDYSRIDAVAATVGPGLVGALLVGVAAAKATALALDDADPIVRTLLEGVLSRYRASLARLAGALDAPPSEGGAAGPGAV